MAGKALKDITALCKCPACGEIKRMHYLCPTCAASMSRPALGWHCFLMLTMGRTAKDDEQTVGGENGATNGLEKEMASF